MPTPNEIILSPYFYCGDEKALDALLANEKLGTAIITSGPIPSLLKILVQKDSDIIECLIPNFNDKAKLDDFFKFAKYKDTKLKASFDDLKSEMKSSAEPQKIIDTFLQEICVNFPMKKNQPLTDYLANLAVQIEEETGIKIIFKQRDQSLEKLVSCAEAEDYLFYHHPKSLMFCSLKQVVVTDEGMHRSICEPNEQGFYRAQLPAPLYHAGGPLDYNGLHTVANYIVVLKEDAFKKKYLQSVIDKAQQEIDLAQQAINKLGNKKPLLEWKLNDNSKKNPVELKITTATI